MRRGVVAGMMAGGQEMWRDLVEEKPVLPYLLPLVLFAWFVERWIAPLSNLIPLLVIVWGMLEYGRIKRKQTIEELHRRWQRQFQLNQPTTSPESCEWLNKLWLTVWPNFFEPKIVRKLLKTVQKRIKEKRPKPIKSIEVQDFSLGTAPPSLSHIHWTTENGVAALNMSFDWVTNEMSILLAAKLAGPLRGKVARIVINSLRIKGDLRIVPILDGTAMLYSFWTIPEVKIGLAFGSGNQTSVPATELPAVSSWLEKLLRDTLIRTLVEPRRRCFALPAVDLKKHAVGGICSVKVLSAKGLKFRPNFTKSNSSSGSSHGGQSSSIKVTNPFVELQLEDLMRKSQVSRQGGASPVWADDDAFDMVLHENTGTLTITVCEAGAVHVGSLGSCQIKVRYVDDDSTIFWATGADGGIVAARAEHCGKEVIMTVPLEPADSGEVIVRLVLKEWQFADGSKAVANYTPSASSLQQSMIGCLSSVPSLSGRKIRITAIEGRNLAPMDKTGKSDPYLKLHYGKIVRKTKTVNQDLNPVWNQSFVFHEVIGEYLKLRCYDADWFGDENLGSARVNLQGLEDGKPKDVWVPLEKIKQGEIKLKIELVDPDFEYDDSQNGRVEENGTLSSRGGMVEIVLVEGRDLIAADWGGTSDPYVSVRYGNTRKRTKVVHKTLAPQWNQTVEFSDDGSPLVLHVKDYNAIMPTSSIGHCEVDYQRLGFNQTMDKWIPLQGVIKGEIHVQITRRIAEKELKGIVPAPSRNVQSNGNMKLQRTAGKVRALIRKALALAEEEEEQDEIRQMLEELESAEEERESVALQLQKDRDLLVAKVKELELAMNGLI